LKNKEKKGEQNEGGNKNIVYYSGTVFIIYDGKQRLGGGQTRETQVREFLSGKSNDERDSKSLATGSD
jgi:hypothetical protein